VYGLPPDRRVDGDVRCGGAIEASERFANGVISELELVSWSLSVDEAYKEAFARSDDVVMSLTIAASYATSRSLSQDKVLKAINAVLAGTTGDWKRERAAQAERIRDIFGNPFRPVAFSPSWRTDTAVTLAQQMYDSREFGAMPILADALQDAGCDSADVLDHCRGPGPHVRGCWVVDLVLGKE